MNKYYEIICEYIQKTFDLGIEHFWNDSKKKELMDGLKDDSISLPAIYIVEGESFVEEDQTEIDLSEEIRVGFNYSITIIAKEIEDIIDLELHLQKVVEQHFPFSSVSDEWYMQRAYLSFDKDKPINRTNSGQGLFQSIVYVNCNSIVLEKNVVHPIKIELDKNVQLQVMKHLALLNEGYQKIIKQASNIVEDERVKAIQKQITSMYNFENLCQEKMTVEDSGFKFCYETMIKDQCDIKKAIELYKQKHKNEEKQRLEKEKAIEKEKERLKKEVEKQLEHIRNLNTIYSGKGDESINCYIDPIVENIKRKLKDYSSVQVYGGSTEAEFYTKYYSHSLEFPCVLVSIGHLEFKLTTNYQSINKEGTEHSHNYRTNLYPLCINCGLRMFTEDKKQGEELAFKLQEMYIASEKILVPDIIYDNEYIPISLVTEQGKINVHQVTMETGKILYRYYCSLCQMEVPYLAKKYDKDVVSNNKIIQALMLKQADYMDECVKKLDSVLKLCNSKYKELLSATSDIITINKKKSLFGTVVSSYVGTIYNVVDKTIDNVFKAEEFVELKKAFAEKKPIDKTKFDSVFKEITEIYPLYEKMIQGWSHEKVKEDLERYKELFLKNKDELCERLDLPKTYKSVTGVIPKNDLKILGNMMYTHSDITLSEAIQIQEERHIEDIEERERIRQERAERERIMREQNAMMEDYCSYEPQSSSGSILKTAAGVAIGNSISNRAHNKRQKEYMKQMDKNQKEFMRQMEKKEEERRRYEERKAREARERAYWESRRNRDAVIKANQERRRKGQPELPLPPIKYML